MTASVIEWCVMLLPPSQSERAEEFKSKIISYLESLMHMQQEVSPCAPH